MKTLPCPFCGKQPIIEKELGWSGKTYWAIACNNEEDCPMESVWGYGFDSEEEAIRAWNVRYVPLPGTATPQTPAPSPDQS
jgi:sarcosine oxidase delta subunit